MSLGHEVNPHQDKQQPPEWPPEQGELGPYAEFTLPPEVPAQSQGSQHETRIQPHETDYDEPPKKTLKQKLGKVGIATGLLVTAGAAAVTTWLATTDKGEAPKNGTPTFPDQSTSAPEVPGGTTSAPAASETISSHESLPEGTIFEMDENGKETRLSVDQWIDKNIPKANIDLNDSATIQKAFMQTAGAIEKLLNLNVKVSPSTLEGLKNYKNGSAGEGINAYNNKVREEILDKIGLKGDTQEQDVTESGHWLTLPEYLKQQNELNIMNGTASKVVVSPDNLGEGTHLPEMNGVDGAHINVKKLAIETGKVGESTDPSKDKVFRVDASFTHEQSRPHLLPMLNLEAYR